MSYNHVRLFNAVRESLSGKPFRTLRDLCRELQISKGTLEKVVITATGKTFKCFREEILVDHLINAFASHPVCTIKEVSRALGYESASSFARAIKHACGLSPAELRSRMAQTNPHSEASDKTLLKGAESYTAWPK